MSTGIQMQNADLFLVEWFCCSLMQKFCSLLWALIRDLHEQLCLSDKKWSIPFIGGVADLPRRQTHPRPRAKRLDAADAEAAAVAYIYYSEASFDSHKSSNISELSPLWQQ